MAKKLKFFVVNVKLQSDKQGEERLQAYDNLIRDLTNLEPFTKLGKNQAITIYRPLHSIHNGIKYYYGRVGKGISFFDRESVSILKDSTLKQEDVEKNKLIDPVVGTYMYIPSIHRFALLSQSTSVHISDFYKLLNEHLHKIISSSDLIEILIQKDATVIERIFEATAVYNLNYEITYSNNDSMGAQGQLFEKILKENHIGKLQVSARSDHSEQGMNISEVNFLGGGIEVAKQNGVIKSASIKETENSKILKVTNEEKPSIFSFEFNKKNEIMDLEWFKAFFSKYRSE